MKKYLIAYSTIAYVFFYTTSSMGQSIDSLSMFKAFGNTRFEYTKDTATYDVSPREVLQIMKNDPLAYAEFKKAKTNYSAAGVVGFIGGGMLAFPLGTAVGGGNPDWALAAGGAALILIAVIPLEGAFRRHAANAIEIYNKKHTAFRPRTQYFLSGLGAKVVIRF